MTILGKIRKLLGRDQQDRQPDHARAVDEQQQRDQAKAWERKGGPVDPGFTA